MIYSIVKQRTNLKTLCVLIKRICKKPLKKPKFKLEILKNNTKISFQKIILYTVSIMIILSLLLAQATCYTPSDCVSPQVCTAILDGVTPGTCVTIEPEPMPELELPPLPPEPEPDPPSPTAPPPPEPDTEPIMIEVPDLELERDVPVLTLDGEEEEPEDEPENPFFLAPIINPITNLFRRAIVSPAQALFCWLTQC